jgi:hypothetical protein
MAITKPTLGSRPNLIARWKPSGLSQAEFYDRRGIALPTFRYHLHKTGLRSVPVPLRRQFQKTGCTRSSAVSHT